MLSLTLPYPPSVNHYWRHYRGMTVLTPAARAYRTVAADAVAGCVPFSVGVSITIYAHPPDRRRRDLDNVLKAVLDTITHSGAWDDDSQVQAIHAEWRPRDEAGEGWVDVMVCEWEEEGAEGEQCAS